MIHIRHVFNSIIYYLQIIIIIIKNLLPTNIREALTKTDTRFITVEYGAQGYTFHTAYAIWLFCT